MKALQKSKYFLFGLVAAAVLAPMAIKAVDTIPLRFKDGDIISATVLNELFARVNDVQRGYTDASEIEGSWVCTTHTTEMRLVGPDASLGGCDPSVKEVGDGMQRFRSQIITFSCASGNCYMAPSEFYPNFCGKQWGGPPAPQRYLLQGNMFIAGGYQPIQKLSPVRFAFPPNYGSNALVTCERKDGIPAPVDGLTLDLNAQGLLLTWTDQSDNEAGFRIQRRTIGGRWHEVAVAPADATSYADSAAATAGYGYRVIAFNDTGASISSSEVSPPIPESGWWTPEE